MVHLQLVLLSSQTVNGIDYIQNLSFEIIVCAMVCLVCSNLRDSAASSIFQKRTQLVFSQRKKMGHPMLRLHQKQKNRFFTVKSRITQVPRGNCGPEFALQKMSSHNTVSLTQSTAHRNSVVVARIIIDTICQAHLNSCYFFHRAKVLFPFKETNLKIQLFLVYNCVIRTKNVHIHFEHQKELIHQPEQL